MKRQRSEVKESLDNVCNKVADDATASGSDLIDGMVESRAPEAPFRHAFSRHFSCVVSFVRDNYRYDINKLLTGKWVTITTCVRIFQTMRELNGHLLGR